MLTGCADSSTSVFYRLHSTVSKATPRSTPRNRTASLEVGIQDDKTIKGADHRRNRNFTRLCLFKVEQIPPHIWLSKMEFALRIGGPELLKQLVARARR